MIAKKTIDPVIVKITAFLLIFCILYSYCSEVLSPKWKYPTDIEDHRSRMEEYRALQSDPQVIFMGTSHVLYGVNPMQIYQETGISTYNMAISAFDIGCGYALLKDVLQYHHPKLLFIDTSTIYLEFSDGAYVKAMGMIENPEARMDLARTYAENYLDSKKEAYDEQQERIEKGLEESPENDKETDWDALKRKAFLFGFSKIYRNHSRWQELTTYDFELKWMNAYEAKGYVFDTLIRGGSYSVDSMNAVAADMEEVREVTETEYYNGRIPLFYRTDLRLPKKPRKISTPSTVLHLPVFRLLMRS